MKEISEEYRNKLQDLIYKKMISPCFLAKEIGLNKATLYSLLNGKRDPHLASLGKIKNYLEKENK